MAADTPAVITRYFDATARKDDDAIAALFADDGTVTDEGRRTRAAGAIRVWREGTASVYEYTTEIVATDLVDDGSYVVTGRLDGNFPGGTAVLKWAFTLVGDQIEHLQIAPDRPDDRAVRLPACRLPRGVALSPPTIPRPDDGVRSSADATSSRHHRTGDAREHQRQTAHTAQVHRAPRTHTVW